MGWWPFGRGSATAKPLPKERQQQLDQEAAQLAALRDAAASSKDGGANGNGNAGAASLLPLPPPRPVSIFEFGKPVAVGAERLVGMCAGDNPDAIQACAWTLEPLQGKPRERRPVYRIEF
jgi:hypothetical protein